MTQTNPTVVYSLNVTIINSLENLATFDHRAGNSYMPVTCTFSFWVNENFVNDLKLLAHVELGFHKYDIINKHISLITLIPLDRYFNKKLEQVICFLFKKYHL